MGNGNDGGNTKKEMTCKQRECDGRVSSLPRNPKIEQEEVEETKEEREKICRRHQTRRTRKERKKRNDETKRKEKHH